MWIDDHLEAAAVNRFSQIALLTDALDAAQADVRAGKNGVAEFEQGE